MGCKKTLILLLAAAGHLASAWPQPPVRAHIHTRQEEIQDEYDYVIVGGGTAGLTVGDRLTENGKYTVLVLESGVFHEKTGMDPSRMFNIMSKPNPSLNGRSFNVGIGRGVGGSSLVNGQVALRGTKEEYDAWKELGGPDSDWDWEGLLPYFQKSTTLVPPSDEIAEEFNINYDKAYWSENATIYTSYGPGKPPPVLKNLYTAMSAMPGVKVAKDGGSGENGLYWYPMLQDPVNWKRSYARTGHWDNVPRENYDMIVSTKVLRVLFDDDMTATGVEYVSLNSTSAPVETVKARREVIVAAGTIHTPQVLMLSGIGAPAQLEAASIEVKVDLPGVGSNFQDHSYIPQIGFEWGNPPNSSEPPPALLSTPNLVAMVGMPAVSPQNYEALAIKFEGQEPRSHLPPEYTDEQVAGYSHQQEVFARLMRSPGTTFNEMMLFRPGGSIQNLHCASRGTVTLNTRDPQAEMLVDYRAATNDIDLDVMVEIIRFMRRYMAQEEFKQFQPRETMPGTSVTTAEQLRTWAKGQIIPSVYHPVGTCAKVPREMGGCVDEKLQVYGTKKLSVIDGSIMPTLVGATTCLTVYAVAEKAADIIKARTFDAI